MADAEWFAALVRSEHQRLVLSCFGLTTDLEIARAATGEAFARAWRWRARLAEADGVDEWLRAVAVHRARWLLRRRAALDRIRRRRGERPAPALTASSAQTLRAVLDLPEEQRGAVLLRHIAGLRLDDIALLQDVAEQTVSLRLAEAGAALAAGDGADPAVDGRLAALRAELCRALPEPDAGAVGARWRARSTRRRRVVAALIVVSVVVVVAVVRTALRPVPDPGEADLAVPAPELGPVRSMVYDVDVDMRPRLQGYALRAVCPARAPSGPCGTEVLYTEDGEFWAIQSRLPTLGITAAGGQDRRIQTLGPHEVMVESTTERWYSDDSALTWRRAPVEPSGTVPAIPAGAVLEPGCFVVSSICRSFGQLLVVLPDSGRSATLATPPALNQVEPGRIQAADGAWWVSGTDPATGRWSLAVSRDAGRGWSITALPPFTGTPQAGITVTAAPHVLYATAVGPLPDTASGLLAIFRSTDAGRTWTTAWQAHGSQPHSLAGTPMVAPDGTLTITTTEGEVYRSTDQATSFHLTTGPARLAQWTRVGYIASLSTNSNTYTWSHDGTRWSDFTVK